MESLIFQANKDWETAELLFKKKYFHHSLFFCQLVLEKILKALIIKNTNKLYPPIHKLILLAQEAHLKLTPEQIKDLNEITTFNISARYDNEKFEFYQKATSVFTKKWFSKTKELKLWLESLF